MWKSGKLGAIVFTKPLCTQESKSGRNNEEFHQNKEILVIGLISFLEMFEIVIMCKYHMIENISIAYFCSMSQVSIESNTMVPCTSMVLGELIMKSSQVWHYNPRLFSIVELCVGQC